MWELVNRRYLFILNSTNIFFTLPGVLFSLIRFQGVEKISDASKHGLNGDHNEELVEPAYDDALPLAIRVQFIATTGYFCHREDMLPADLDKGIHRLNMRMIEFGEATTTGRAGAWGSVHPSWTDVLFHMTVTTTVLNSMTICPMLMEIFSDIQGGNSLIVEVLDMEDIVEEVLNVRTAVLVKSK